ncbi:ExbD/TolR family protein [Leptospira wolffii]|uniref:Biopolymer transporter ExbD n=1 Tax=Leptospira wolffii TaxID=409998 RepID=A0A2M9ZBR4_9LEPT|nr:biopolymer transporter ExbD [Leptospira wolffii]EPG65981.1 transport energizing protein, ExbD/TolR family [Leptospira wolffii serovar Khorat str. Khorat-H2]PJZ65870.1 biopolymer transporter ExbD [Leptospira wolffii]TGK59410.1 biopolymer transporter ExbD [Leptospira wolffii]TGK71207.1 biopolymer transporter ExbD [Leptospira wolffii]TGK77775.1 biopolymer transporter ExbD [Leptospira wolffii]
MKKSFLEDEDIGVDLTSFIDVVFILLIFVMLAVSFRKEIRSIPLELPKIGQGEDPKGERIEIGLLPDGNFDIAGERMDRKVLISRLESGLVREKEVRFFAGESANYGEIVRTLDLLKRSGTSSLELAVQEGK